MKYLLEKAEMKQQLAGFNVVWCDFALSTDLESLKKLMTTMDRIVDAKTGDVVLYGTQIDEVQNEEQN